MGCPLSLPPSGNPSSTGRKGVCGKPGKGVLHEDDPHFSELFEALKNASACRKGFFDKRRGQPNGLSPLFSFTQKEACIIVWMAS